MVRGGEQRRQRDRGPEESGGSKTLAGVSVMVEKTLIELRILVGVSCRGTTVPDGVRPSI